MEPSTPSPASAGTTAGTPPPFPVASPLPARSLGVGLLLAVLAVVAWFLARRRRRAPRLVEIVESASLGPKRSLVVARMGGELLLIGSSEGGIALLSTRPAPPAAAEASAPARGEPHDPSSQPRAAPAALAATLLSRLDFRRRPSPPSPEPFDALLAESVEDLELRRKLAAGHVGSVR